MAKFQKIKSRFAAQFKKRKTKPPVSKEVRIGVQDISRGTFGTSSAISEAFGMKPVRLKGIKKKKKRVTFIKVGGKFVKR